MEPAMNRLTSIVAAAALFPVAASSALAQGVAYNRSIAPTMHHSTSPDGKHSRITCNLGWETTGDEARDLGLVLNVYVNGALAADPVPVGALVVSGSSFGCRGFCNACHGTCITIGNIICICIDLFGRQMDTPLPQIAIDVPALHEGDFVMARIEPLPGTPDEIVSSDDQAFMTIQGAPPCPADFTGDGVVNSQDFFAFLTAFFQGSPNADFNNDGGVNSQDFFDFLGSFFMGC
jgi:hypothetical protein